MPWRFSTRPWTLALLLPLACKEPEAAAVQNRAQQAQAALAEGRAYISKGESAPAIAALRKAMTAAPESAEPLLLMAEAQRLAGNDGAAILALKQAKSLVGDDPALQRQLADLYLQDGHTQDALSTLIRLRDTGSLPDADVLKLARIQAREGQIDAAFKTLEAILRENPDDPEAKAVEAEILLLKGDELLAANLMDRLLAQDAGLTSARLLRARYFLNSGFPEMAEADLGAVQGPEAARTDVVTLRARVLLALSRPADAEAALRKLVEAEPRNAEALAWLAETVLAQGRVPDAQTLVDKALQLRPSLPRAQYVRGRVQEEQGDRRGAEESYRFALTAEPRFAAAHSRMWRLHLKAERKAEAQASLERLLTLGEASLEEKAALAGLYATLQTKVSQGLKLIDEALKREPDNAEYLRTKKALTALLPKPKKRSGPIIIRGGR
ncbi:tetratricopeptide repeat protein [Pyxidicoccus fallax]|uniref:Tetratricopeptide repeat protein n=1 Tax=Pyxidicoccus fallax TaxID=394095 RepID=A0A848LZ15_9BACT|nr:tetratricopeptide repeat protein [Pyxidicoccus fallax]NMO22879.1 tetratricopeptide repeat protein [Pyxidicoccus fallax]NPC86309.1 tetratricopeptide repeat protein [Pyxidicoccus fallax]